MSFQLNSIGFRSGEYGGRKMKCNGAPSRLAVTIFAWCIAALSRIIAISLPGFSFIISFMNSIMFGAVEDSDAMTTSFPFTAIKPNRVQLLGFPFFALSLYLTTFVFRTLLFAGLRSTFDSSRKPMTGSLSSGMASSSFFLK